jgi:hypothetical protein
MQLSTNGSYATNEVIEYNEATFLRSSALLFRGPLGEQVCQTYVAAKIPGILPFRL